MLRSNDHPFGKPLLSLALSAALLAGLGACSETSEEEAKTPAPASEPETGATDTKADANRAAGAAAAQARRDTTPVTRSSAYSRIEKVLVGKQRTAEERARDGYRHPLETLSFFGLERGSHVIEITPGSGWYSAIISPVVHPMGEYVAAIPDESLPGLPDYVPRLNKQLTDRFRADYRSYGLPLPIRKFNPDQPTFGPPASADMVLSFRNAHNWVSDGTAAAYFHGFFQVLKPGGTLGIVDHRAAAGAATDGSTGYVTEQQIIDLATGAGFRLADRSEINANPKDTRDHPDGVWTLPPTYALKDVDREKYRTIGESDRMTLKFVKP